MWWRGARALASGWARLASRASKPGANRLYVATRGPCASQPQPNQPPRMQTVSICCCCDSRTSRNPPALPPAPADANERRRFVCTPCSSAISHPSFVGLARPPLELARRSVHAQTTPQTPAETLKTASLPRAVESSSSGSTGEMVGEMTGRCAEMVGEREVQLELCSKSCSSRAAFREHDVDMVGDHG